MRFKILAMVAMFATSAWSQTDLVYPWMTNNSLFQGTFVINNLNNETVTVNLTATRQAGSDPETESLAPIEIGPYGQAVLSAADAFQGLGAGGGYMIRMTSDASDITGAFVIVGTDTPSGSSPSQANVFRSEDAANVILFSFLSINDSGFSSPVVINMGDADAVIRFHAYQNGQKVATTERTVPSLHPLAELTRDIFPAQSGNLYVAAESDQPLLGVAFIFNSSREPSMANATPLSVLPDPGGNQQPTVSFSGDIQPIFNASCGTSACHLNGGMQQGLDLDDSSHDSIVNVSATGFGFTDLMLVAPGDPDNSYLYRKLLPTSQASYFGLRMPRGRAALSNADIEKIRTWILEGALDN